MSGSISAAPSLLSGIFTQAAAQAALGLGSMAKQSADAVTLTGGTVDGVAIGGTTPATAAFTTIASSGGIIDESTPNGILGLSTTGTLTWGGTYLPNGGSQGGVMQNVVSYTFPISTSPGNGIRNRYLVDLVTVDANSSVIDEGMFLERSFTGSGILSGELNGYHCFFNIGAGVTDTQSETFESSALNFGTVINHDMFLGIYTNERGATTANLSGIGVGFTNLNPNAGAFEEWTAFGAGPPILGSTSVATTGASGNGTTATVTFTGTDVVPVGAAVTLAGLTPAGYNAVGAVVTASSAGSVSYANATTGAQTVAGTVTFTGSAPTTSWHFRSTDPNSMNGFAGRVNIGTTAEPPSNTGLTVSGPGSATTDYALITYNSSGAKQFWVTDLNSATFSGALTVGEAGTTAGSLTLSSITAGTAVQLISGSGGSGIYHATFPNNSGTVAEVNFAQTWSALQLFSAHIGGTGTTPTINSGGTLDARASDLTGTVTTTAGSTGFVITWETPYTAAPHVVITSPSGNAFTSYTSGTATLTLVCAALTGATFSYQVIQ